MSECFLLQINMATADSHVFRFTGVPDYRPGHVLLPVAGDCELTNQL